MSRGGNDIDINRRSFLRGAGMVAGGAALGASGVLGTEAIVNTIANNNPLPFYTGYATTIHDGRRTPPAQAEIRVVWSAPSSGNTICLTFDDGPMPDWTPRVLATLAEKSVPATFFLRGDHVKAHADILRDGIGVHEFANHSWDHHDMARMDYGQCRDQIDRTNDEIEARLGKRPTLMRPPYGHMAGALLLALNDAHMTPILWNLQMPESDFAANPDGLIDYIGGAVGAGDIILAHDTGPAERLICIDRLDRIIDAIRARGFEFATVSEAIGA